MESDECLGRYSESDAEPPPRLSFPNCTKNCIVFICEFHPGPGPPSAPDGSPGAVLHSDVQNTRVSLPAQCSVHQLRLSLCMQAQQLNFQTDPLGLLDPDQYIMLYTREGEWYEIYDDCQVLQTLNVPWTPDASGAQTARIVIIPMAARDLEERRHQQQTLAYLIGHNLYKEASNRLGELSFTCRKLVLARRRELKCRDAGAYATEPWTTLDPIPKDLQLHFKKKVPVKIHFRDNICFQLKVETTVTPSVLLKVARRVILKLSAECEFSNMVLKVCGREEFLSGDFPLCDFLWVRQCIKTMQDIHLSLVPLTELVETTVGLVDWHLVDSYTGQSSSHKDLCLEEKDLDDIFMISLWECNRKFRVKLLGFDIPKAPFKSSQLAYVEASIIYGNKVLSSISSTTKTFLDEVLWSEWLEFEILLKDLPRGVKLGLTINTTGPSDGHQATKNQQKDKWKMQYFVNMLLIDHRSILSQGPHTLHMWPHQEEASTYQADKLSTASNPDVTTSMAISFLLDRYSFPVVLPHSSTTPGSRASSPSRATLSPTTKASASVSSPSFSPSSPAPTLLPTTMATASVSSPAPTLSPTPNATASVSSPVSTLSPTPNATAGVSLPAFPPSFPSPTLSPTTTATASVSSPAFSPSSPAPMLSLFSHPVLSAAERCSPKQAPALPPKFQKCRRASSPALTSSLSIQSCSSSPPPPPLPKKTRPMSAMEPFQFPPSCSLSLLSPAPESMVPVSPLKVSPKVSPSTLFPLQRFQDVKVRYASNLPNFLRTVNWLMREAVEDVHWLLSQWVPGELDLSVALELLSVDFADDRVRRLAVQRLEMLSDSEVLRYLLQLVQTLKVEPYHDSFLAQFLIQRALRSKRIGHFFFWYVRSEVSSCPYFRQRMAVLLEAYLLGCGESMLDSFRKQVQAVEALQEVAIQVKKLYPDRTDLPPTAALKAQELLRSCNLPSDFLVPFDPRVRAGKILLDKCKIMASKKKPLWLEFTPASTLGPPGPPVGIIFKVGDDLRQDMLVIQTLVVMASIWQQDKSLDLHLVPYGCISTGHNTGMIEIVRDAVTIAAIHREAGGTTGAFNNDALYEWMRRMSPLQDLPYQAMERFVYSCAGYCVATYVLGIGDRHNDNIMITDQGNLFHIDFGHILGNTKRFLGWKRERVPFVLTPDFLCVMGKVKGRPPSLYFQRFKDTCTEAYLSLHSHSHLLTTLFSLMLLTGIPKLSAAEDMQYLRVALQEDEDEDRAREHFMKQIAVCEDLGWTVQTNWWIHMMAGIK